MSKLLLTDGRTSDYGTYGRMSAKRAYKRMLGATALYAIVGIAVVLIMQIAMIMAFGTERTAELLDDARVLLVIQVISMYLIAFPVFVLCVRNLPSALRRRSNITAEKFVVLVFICEAAMIFGAIISNSITSFLSVALGYDITNATSDLLTDAPIWLVIAVAVVIGPIIEELIFRKYFIDKLGVFGDRTAVVVSAVAFGLFHGNLSQLIYATALGFVLGYTYVVTRQVKYTALMHIIINFVGTVPSLLLADSYDRLVNTPPEAELNSEQLLQMMQDTMNVFGLAFLQYAFAITGLVLFIYCTVKKKYRIENECDIVTTTRQRASSVILNSGTLLFVLICAYQIYASLLPQVS